MLAIDSNFEPATKAAFDYRQAHVYPYISLLGYSIIRCQGPLARRVYVAPEARKPNVVFMTGVGHGSYDTYTGDHFEPIFTVGDYSPEESNGKIVHFLSCQTAARLGPDFVAHGCRAYFGYDENFTFMLDVADVFFECDSEIDRAIAEGLRAMEVYRRTRALYDRRIADFRSSGKLREAAALEFDRDHLRSPVDGHQWGDGNTHL